MPELISRIARCARVASFCSTIGADARRRRSRTIAAVAGRVVEHAAVRTVTALPARRGSSTSAAQGLARSAAGRRRRSRRRCRSRSRRASSSAHCARRGRCRAARPAPPCARLRGDLGQVGGRPGRGRGRRRRRGVRARARGAAATTWPTRLRPPSGVQDLGGRRLHPGALARGEDDDGGRSGGAHARCAPRRVGGQRRARGSPPRWRSAADGPSRLATVAPAGSTTRARYWRRTRRAVTDPVTATRVPRRS